MFDENKAKQKANSILEFIAFLFTYDEGEITDIVRTIYEKIGPTDSFLAWGKLIAHRASTFFTELFQSKQVDKFIQLKTDGWQALSTIILDINDRLGLLRIFHSNKVSMKTDTTDQITVPEKDQGKGPMFVYTTRSPFLIVGMGFLEELLFVVKDSKVYEQITKLIIHFVVNLQDNIVDKTREVREQFMRIIVHQIKKIHQQNVYNDKVKIKLDTYISFIQEIIAETEKDGLEGVYPHFENIMGEFIELKFENNYGKENMKEKQFKIQMNQNSTLWRLKIRLSEILAADVATIDVIKYVNPMSDTLNGKSLTQLFFNGETLKVDKKSTKQIPKHDLLNSDKSALSHKFNKIVQSWFENYKKDGEKMGIDELKKLSGECWKGSLLRQNNRLSEMLKKYDEGEKDYLLLDEFKRFFLEKSIQNPAAIWKIVNLSGYRNDFKHSSEPEIRVASPEVAPRKILSQQQVFQIFFEFLNNPTFQPVHLSIYRLICFLETNSRIKDEIVQSPTEALEKCQGKYQLAYTLDIILSLVQSNEALFIGFYESGGCLAITNLLEKTLAEDKSLYSLEPLLKNYVIPNMMRIMNLYLFPLKNENKAIRMIQQWKLNLLELDQLESKITVYQSQQKKKLQERVGQEPQTMNGRLQRKLIEHPQKFRFDVLYTLSKKILLNMVKHYQSEFLQKITNQTSKMLGVSCTEQDMNLKDYIVGVKSESLNLRRAAHNAVYLNLCVYKEKVQGFLVDLLDELPTQSKYVYNSYFSLLSKTILKAMEQNPDDEPFIKLTRMLFDKLYTYLGAESRTAIIADKVLLGLLLNIKIILSNRESICKAVINEKYRLVETCLFFYGAQEKIKEVQITDEMLKNEKQTDSFDNYVKCKTDDTRKILHQVIYHLHKASVNEDPNFFTKTIMPVLDEIKEPRKGGFKSTAVGLNNLGSTCYMNSMLQVLNSIGPFRNGLMKTESNALLVSEIKNMFSYLFFSERVDYIPLKMLEAFNPPINPRLQQDTTQFLNYLFDQLEVSLKDTNFNHILKQLFQGNQVAQMICHACGKRRQRIQEFFTYSVDIEGKYQLKTALEGMHQGEVISDCLCDSCGARADTTKRSVLNQIPNIFFLHLKRIVFNYDVFINTKIHTRLQFPNQINIEPYTREGLDLREKLGVQYLKGLKQNSEQAKKFEEMTQHNKPKDYYNLKLKGIIVHSGTADVGHYYAIIQRPNGWVKFDDSRVGMFSVSDFDTECYGGTWVSDEWGGFGSSVNAYVLVYEKVLKNPITIREKEDVQVQIPFQKFQTYNDAEHYKEVWLDNHQLMLENQLLGNNHCKDFLHFSCKILQLSPQQNKVDVIAQLIYKICVYSSEVGALQNLFNKNLHQITPNILKSYILTDRQKTFNILFHYERRIRQFVSRFIEGGIIIVYKQGDSELKSQIIEFLQFLLSELHSEVAKNWMRIDGYLRLFKRIVQASIDFPDLYQFVIRHNFITTFVDFVMEKSSPLNISHKKYSLGTKSNPVNFSSALQTIAFLLKRSYGFNGENYEVPQPPADQILHISDNDVICLCFMPFYEKMIRERQNCEALSIIIQRLCIKNLPFSEAISRVLLKCINEITDAKDEMKDMLQIVCAVLAVRDNFWVQRAEFILGYSTPYIFDSNIISSIDEERFIFASTLHDLFPIQCLLSYAHINRLRNPLAVSQILFIILKACSVSDEAMFYLARQVSPSYIHCRYIDWVRPYLQNLIAILNVSQKQKEELQQDIDLAKKYLEDLEKFIEQNKGKFSQPFITGIFLSKTVEFETTNEDIDVIIRNCNVYCLDSVPNTQGNTAVDQYLKHGRLSNPIDDSSNILFLFKQIKPALAIDLKPVQENEDKEIISLFDEDFNNIKTEPKENILQEKVMEKLPLVETVQENKPKIDQQNIKPENQPQGQKSKQEKQIMDEELQIINIPQLSTCEYFKQIQVVNKGSGSRTVVLNFDKSENVNTILPSKISFIVTNKSSDSMWLFKEKPREDWGHIKFSITAENPKKDKNQGLAWYKTYGQLKPQERPQESEEGNNQDSEPMDIQNYPQNNKQHEAQGSGSGIHSCPICTFINPASVTQCEICGSPIG